MMVCLLGERPWAQLGEQGAKTVQAEKGETSPGSRVQLGLKLMWVPSPSVPGMPTAFPRDREHSLLRFSLLLPGYCQSQGATPSVPHCTGPSAGTDHLRIRMRLVVPEDECGDQWPHLACHSRSSERNLTGKHPETKQGRAPRRARPQPGTGPGPIGEARLPQVGRQPVGTPH